MKAEKIAEWTLAGKGFRLIMRWPVPRFETTRPEVVLEGGAVDALGEPRWDRVLTLGPEGGRGNDSHYRILIAGIQSLAAELARRDREEAERLCERFGPCQELTCEPGADVQFPETATHRAKGGAVTR